MSQAHEAGYLLSVASGRPLCTVNKRILESGVMDYAVCANGATVTRLCDGVHISHTPMLRQDALDCHSMLAPFKPAWNAFFDGKAYFEWKGASYMLTGRTGAVARTQRYSSNRQNVVKRLARLAWRGVRYAWRMLTNSKNRQVPSVRPFLARAKDGVDKIGCTIPDANECARAAQLLRDDGRFEVIRVGNTELEITARGVTKGTGTVELMRALGVSSKDAVAFGDSSNDLPLADVVGRFIAVKNADEKVRLAAYEVCPPVDEDGVAVWIGQNLLM